MKTKTIELSAELKNLYRHWGFHSAERDDASDNPSGPEVNKEVLKQMAQFTKERMNIWDKKTRGEEPPYTQDEILSTYRFCNIFREFDRQTIEIHSLLNTMRGDLPLWLLNMFYSRMVARPETIRRAGLLSFDKENNRRVYEELMNLPRPIYGVPYVFPISVIQGGPTPTRELFVTKHLPSVIQEIASEISGWKRKSVYEGVGRILPIFKYRLYFHWTEVLIDTAYQFPEFIDLFGRFPVGPGAAPTMTRLNPDMDPSLLAAELPLLNVESGVTYEGDSVRLSAENWEGICCEFRKYTNLKEGRGRRRIYRGDKKSPPQTSPLL